jgi:sugar O-acyltransferase (sialic acid O-acetyltransferase NeuD family)
VQVVDDDPATWGTLHGLAPVLGAVEVAAELVDQDVVLTLGKGQVRRRIAARLDALGLHPARYTSLVHPRVVLPGSCSLGSGCVVLDGVVLTADVEVGEHVVIMPHVTLTHGNVVEDFATLCAGVVLGGDVRVGEAAYLGMSSSVREGVTIGAGATLGMGSVLLHDLPAGETWAGVPARPLPIGVPA